MSIFPSSIEMGFGIFGFIFLAVIFILVVGVFIFVIVKGLSAWHSNNTSPRLTVEATLVSRRTDTSSTHHTDSNSMTHTDVSTWYYLTFQVESGDRMEFCVSSQDYGMAVEGDIGRLTFQGTRFLGFERGL